MSRRTRPCSRGCRSAWSPPSCSGARRSPWMPRRWKRTPRCGASCGGTPGKATSSSSPGWPRPRASGRRAEKRWPGSTVGARNGRPMRRGGIRGTRTRSAEALARVDRRRKKRTSNAEWVNPSDPDAKVTQLKDGRTHLAHKVEHAVDLETGALVAVTLHGADVGDPTSVLATTLTAAEQLAAVHAATPTALV